MPGSSITVLRNQLAELRKLARDDPDLLTALHWLATSAEKPQGFEAVFRLARDAPRPGPPEAQRAIRQVLAGRACTHQVELAIPEAQRVGWSLAYALSWISVAGENSVMPPWVRHQFPEAGAIVRRLRDTSCTDPACAWCRSWSDPASPSRAMVRLRGISAEAGRGGRTLSAGGSRRGGTRQVLRSRHPPDRNRQVALLPAPGARQVSPDRRAHGRHLAARRAHGRPGREPEAAGHLVLRHRQRAPVPARALRRARSCPPRRRFDAADFAGAAQKPFGAVDPGAAGSGLLGRRRSALRLQVGPRFSAGLPLRRPLHPGIFGRWRTGPADLPDRDGQARRHRRHLRTFRGEAGRRSQADRRRRA